MMTQVDFAALDLADVASFIPGANAGPRQFVGTATFAQLKRLSPNPMDLQSSFKGVRSDEMQELAEIDTLIQRAVTGAKKSNIPKYRDYILEVVTGQRVGVLPSIHLWTGRDLQTVQKPDGGKHLVVTVDTLLMALDGQSQYTGHWLVQARDSAATPEQKELHAKYPLVVTVHHGIPLADARQMFHDLNILGVKLNTALGLASDSHDPLLQMLDDLIVELPFLTNRVDREGRQLTKGGGKVLNLSTLRQMLVNVAFGISGIQYGAKPVDMTKLDLPALRATARAWFGALFNSFGPQIADRENSVLSSPAVLAALGARANDLLAFDETTQGYYIQQRITELSTIDWRKDGRWVGVAGKLGKNGNLAVGGAKEYGYAVYGAITDPTSAAGVLIRKPAGAWPQLAPPVVTIPGVPAEVPAVPISALA